MENQRKNHLKVCLRGKSLRGHWMRDGGGCAGGHVVGAWGGHALLLLHLGDGDDGDDDDDDEDDEDDDDEDDSSQITSGSAAVK